MKRIKFAAIFFAIAMLVATDSAFARHGDDDDDSSSSSSRSSSSRSSSSTSRSSSSSAGSSSSTQSNSSGSSAGTSSGSELVRKRIPLTASSGIVTNAQGRAEYRGTRDKKQRRLIVTLKVPVGSETPALASAEAAGDVNLIALVQRNGDALVQCIFEFDRIAQQRGQTRAEFKAEVRSKRNRPIRTQSGSCEVSGQQVPVLRRGDIVEVRDVNGIFLTGDL